VDNRHGAQDRQHGETEALGTWSAIGADVGAAPGVAVGSPELWMLVGVGVGTAISATSRCAPSG
jgi:hypothetical protein